MNEKTHQPHSEISPHLAEELQTVIGYIMEHVGQVSGEPLAIVRLIDSLTHNDWVKLASSHDLHDWFAFSIGKDKAEIIQELLTSQQHLLFQRDHDALTGLPNRTVFFERLTIELTRSKRTHGDASVAMIDIDDFKKVNDTYGHLCGDIVLKELATQLSSGTRPYDTASRVGGEEFAILLPSTPITTARSIIDAMRDDFSRHVFTCNDTQFSCTFSGGVSSVKALGTCPTPEEIFESADKAMYTAKRNGKNQVSIHRADYLQQDKLSLVRSNEKQFLFSGIMAENKHE